MGELMCSWQESATGHPLHKCGDTGGVLRTFSLPSNPIYRRRPSDPQTHDSPSVLYYDITNRQTIDINWGSNICEVLNLDGLGSKPRNPQPTL